jgi:hypothetical protein
MYCNSNNTNHTRKHRQRISHDFRPCITFTKNLLESVLAFCRCGDLVNRVESGHLFNAETSAKHHRQGRRNNGWIAGQKSKVPALHEGRHGHADKLLDSIDVKTAHEALPQKLWRKKRDKICIELTFPLTHHHAALTPATSRAG